MRFVRPAWITSACCRKRLNRAARRHRRRYGPPAIKPAGAERTVLGKGSAAAQENEYGNGSRLEKRRDRLNERRSFDRHSFGLAHHFYGDHTTNAQGTGSSGAPAGAESAKQATRYRGEDRRCSGPRQQPTENQRRQRYLGYPGTSPERYFQAAS